MGYSIITKSNKYVNFTDDLPSLIELVQRFPNFSTVDHGRYINVYTSNSDCTIEVIYRNRCTIISLIDYKLSNCAIYVNGSIYYMYNYVNGNLHGTQMLTLYDHVYMIHMNHGRYLKTFTYNGKILNYGTVLRSISIFDELLETLKKIDNEIRNLLR